MSCFTVSAPEAFSFPASCIRACFPKDTLSIRKAVGSRSFRAANVNERLPSIVSDTGLVALTEHRQECLFHLDGENFVGLLERLDGIFPGRHEFVPGVALLTGVGDGFSHGVIIQFLSSID